MQTHLRKINKNPVRFFCYFFRNHKALKLMSDEPKVKDFCCISITWFFSLLLLIHLSNIGFLMTSPS